MLLRNNVPRGWATGNSLHQHKAEEIRRASDNMLSTSSGSDSPSVWLYKRATVALVLEQRVYSQMNANTKHTVFCNAAKIVLS